MPARRTLLSFALAFGLSMNAPLRAQAAGEPRITMDASGAKAVAIAGMPSSDGCAPHDEGGRVVALQIEKAAIISFTYVDRHGSRSLINVARADEFKDAGTWERVRKALGDVIVIGHDVQMQMVLCGASGRVLELTGVSLRDTPSAKGTTGTLPGQMPTLMLAPAAARRSPMPTRWKITRPSRVQADIEIASDDKKFHFSVSCMSRASGPPSFSTFFVGPRNWSAQTDGKPVSIDGIEVAWEIDGADEGVVLSDSVENNAATLSPIARMLLARGERLAVNGRIDRGPKRSAVFDLSGGEAIWAEFEARCRSLPRS